VSSRSDGDSSVQKTKEQPKFQKLQRELGRRVRELRDGKELTLYQAQELTGVDYKHLQKVEAGQLNVTLATLHRIAEGFGVSVADLFAARSRR
jgi:transcriptional regulator with XRE-family HTH domain